MRARERGWSQVGGETGVWPVWRMRQVRYGPQHRATTRTIKTVTRAARVSSLYNKSALAWLSLDFMDFVRVEKLLRICWLVG